MMLPKLEMSREKKVLQQIRIMKSYLFLHIPKTAGTSIIECLPRGQCSIENFFENNKNNSDLLSCGYGAPRHHYTLEQYGNIGLDGIDELYKFTFVRNPWDRVVSIFHDWQKQNELSLICIDTGTNQQYKLINQLPDDYFSYFVSNLLAPALDPSVEVKGYYPVFEVPAELKQFLSAGVRPGDQVLNITNYTQPTKGCPYFYTIANGHYTPQVKYTHDSFGNQIVDFIGKLETLQQDFDKLNKFCGWSLKFMTLPHLNKSKRASKDYRRYYEDASGLAKHLVSEIYREDIEAYGYTF